MGDRLFQYWEKGRPVPDGARLVNDDFHHLSDLIEWDDPDAAPCNDPAVLRAALDEIANAVHSPGVIAAVLERVGCARFKRDGG